MTTGAKGYTAGVRKALPLIQRGVRAGLSANKIIDALRGAGMSMRRQDALEAVRNIKGDQKKANTIKNVRKDYFPSDFLASEIKTSIFNPYSYTVAVKGIDPETSEEKIRYVTVSSKKRLTIRQVESEAQDLITEATEKYQIEFVEATVVRYQKK